MARKNGTEAQEPETALTIKEVRTHLKSISPYSQSRVLQSKPAANESHDEHDSRCWKERCHVMEGHKDPSMNGRIFLPPMAFKNAIVSAAKLLKEKIPGQGRQEYGKQFECGVLVAEGLITGTTIETVKSERLFVPSDGRKGGGSRVYRTFPLVSEWEGEVTWYVTSPLITEKVFRKYVEVAGMMIGVGRFRVERGGYYGRFELASMDWPKPEEQIQA